MDVAGCHGCCWLSWMLLVVMDVAGCLVSLVYPVLLGRPVILPL